MSKEKQKKKGSIGKIILLAVLILIILTIMAYLNSGIGLGAGMGGILGSGEAVDAAATAVNSSEPVGTEEVVKSEPGVVNIIISGDTITVDGEKQADIEAFDTAISKLDGGEVKFRLLDDGAIDYTYTEVKSRVEKYSFTIIEETTLADYKAR